MKEEYQSINKSVEEALKDQGRSKFWLATKLGMSRPTLDKRLKTNLWKLREVFEMKHLGVI